LCKATNGLCGTKGECKSSYTTNVIISNSDFKQDCSRTECKAKAELAYAITILGCNSLPPVLKETCKATAYLTKSTAISGCDSFCKNP